MSSDKGEFKPDDAEDKNAWDICAPIFDQFYIIGPDRKGETKTIYNFPKSAADGKYEMFLFPDSIYLEPLHFKNKRNVMNCFSSNNEILDNIIFYRVDGSSPIFVYACIFKATPLSFPGIRNGYAINQLIQYKENFSTVPQFKCAFVFVTSHPFHDLYFGLLKALVNLEFQTRNTLKNLEMLSEKDTLKYELNPMEYWPYTSFSARENFLNALYNTNLPILEETLGIKFNIANFDTFVWQMPEPRLMQYSPAKVGFDPFMSWVDPEQYVKLVECLLIGYNFIVAGTNYKEITKVISFLPNLIAPFTWSYNVISFVPESIIDFLDSPFPFIDGIFIKYLPEEKANGSETVLIDVDQRTIKFPEETYEMPEREDVIDSMSPIFQNSDLSDFNNVQSILKLTQDRIFDTIIKNMQNSIECRLDVPNPGTRFNKDKYISQYTDPRDLRFIEKLTESQNFACLINKLCLINTKIKRGIDVALEGLGEWAASIWKMQHQNASFENKNQVAVNLLNRFNPIDIKN